MKFNHSIIFISFLVLIFLFFLLGLNYTGKAIFIQELNQEREILYFDNFNVSNNYLIQEAEDNWQWILDEDLRILKQIRNTNGWQESALIINSTNFNITNIGDRLIFSLKFSTNKTSQHTLRLYFSNNTNLSQGNGYNIRVSAFPNNDEGWPDYHTLRLHRIDDNLGVLTEKNSKDGLRYGHIEENYNYTIIWSLIKLNETTIINDIFLVSDDNKTIDHINYYSEIILEEGYFGFGDKSGQGGFENSFYFLKVEKEESNNLNKEGLGEIKDIQLSENKLDIYFRDNEVIYFEFLEEDILRMRLDIGYNYETSQGNNFTLKQKEWTNPSVFNLTNSSYWIFQTNKIRLVIPKESTFSYTIYRNDSNQWVKSIKSFNGGFGYNFNDNSREFYLEKESDERIFGLLNNGLRGDLEQSEHSIIRNQSRIVSSEHGQIASPYFYSNKGWGVFYDTTYSSFFNYTDNQIKINYSSLNYGVNNLELDIYYIIKDDIKSQLTEYTKLVGRYEIPPKYSAGYMISRWLNQSEWSSFGSKESYINNISLTYREKNIPVDVFIFDYDWFGGNTIAPNTLYNDTFTWDLNESHFPNYLSLLNNLSELGFNIIGIRKPNILTNDSFFSTFLSVFNTSQADYYWNKHTLNNSMGHSLLKNNSQVGFSGWWLDESDPNDPVVDSMSFYDDDSIRRYGIEIKNIYTQTWAEIFNTRNKLNRNERIWLIARSGYTGMQKQNYAVWTGDIGGQFEDLKDQPTSILNGGMLGVPYVTFDAGGFGGTTGSEQFVRWMQLGLVSPIYRSHSSMNTDPRFPWLYGDDAEKITKNTNELRMQLLPYIYNTYYESSQTGLPISRHLILEYPNNNYINNLSNQNQLVYQWMFGENLLVAPIMDDKLNQGYDTIKIYFPEGNWLDFFTYDIYEGNQEVNYNISKQENRISEITNTNWNSIPIFQKENTIIPMYKYPRQYFNDSFEGSEDILLRIFPSKEIGFNYTYQLYDDDGYSYDYLIGNFSLQNFTVNVISSNSGNRIVNITIGNLDGSFNNMLNVKNYTLLIYEENNIQSIKINGENTLNYNYNNSINLINISLNSVNLIDNQTTYIEVETLLPLKIEEISLLDNQEVCNPVIVFINASDGLELDKIDLYFQKEDTVVLYENNFTIDNKDDWTSESNNKNDWIIENNKISWIGSQWEEHFYLNQEMEDFTYIVLVNKTNLGGIAFNYVNTNNFWRYYNEGGYMKVRGKVNGGWTNAGNWEDNQFESKNLINNHLYWYKIKVNNTHIMVKNWIANESEPEDWTNIIPETRLNTGKIGFLGRQNSRIEFSNLMVYSRGLIWSLNETKISQDKNENITWIKELPFGINKLRINISNTRNQSILKEYTLNVTNNCNLIGLPSNIQNNGIQRINLTINNSSHINRFFEDIQEVKILDLNNTILKFDYNFTKSNLDLNNITIYKNNNSIMVNLGQEIDYKKTIYLENKNFLKLCVKDSIIYSFDEISENCNESNEINFDSCLNNTNINQNGIICSDFGDIIVIENLNHSAIRGINISSSNIEEEPIANNNPSTSSNSDFNLILNDSNLLEEPQINIKENNKYESKEFPFYNILFLKENYDNYTLNNLLKDEFLLFVGLILLIIILLKLLIKK